MTTCTTTEHVGPFFTTLSTGQLAGALSMRLFFELNWNPTCFNREHPEIGVLAYIPGFVAPGGRCAN